MSIKKVRRMILLSVFCCALRLVFHPLPTVQPFLAFLLIGVLYAGLSEMLVVMTVSLVVSAIFLGFGVWLTWQMTALTLVLLIWRLLARFLSFEKALFRVLILAILVAFCALFYGVLMDSCIVYVYHIPWVPYVLSGLPFHGIYAASTVCFFFFFLGLFKKPLSKKGIRLI